MNERLKMKRQREEERGRLSELLDCVLLHVMEFMHMTFTSLCKEQCPMTKVFNELQVENG